MKSCAYTCLERIQQTVYKLMKLFVCVFAIVEIGNCLKYLPTSRCGRGITHKAFSPRSLVFLGKIKHPQRFVGIQFYSRRIVGILFYTRCVKIISTLNNQHSVIKYLRSKCLRVGTSSSFTQLCGIN